MNCNIIGVFVNIIDVGLCGVVLFMICYGFYMCNIALCCYLLWFLNEDIYVLLRAGICFKLAINSIKCTCNTVSTTHHYTRYWHTPPCWHAHAREQVVVVAILGLPHVLLFYRSRKRSRKSREGSGDYSLK